MTVQQKMPKRLTAKRREQDAARLRDVHNKAMLVDLMRQHAYMLVDDTIRDLHDSGWSLRDIASILGVSQTRVHQRYQAAVSARKQITEAEAEG